MVQAALPVDLRRGCGIPLHVQLATQVRALLRRGVLDPGARLPSTRALAAELGVARAVVEQAYDQLLAEGWLVARRGSGTFVAEVGGPRALASPRSVGEPALPTTRASWEAPENHGEYAAAPRDGRQAPIRLSTGTPWRDPRPHRAWRRAWRDVALADPPTDYPDPAGLPELRAEVARHLAQTRGLACPAEEVVITAGTTHGMELALAVLGDGAVAVEDPGYRAAVAAVRHSGRTLLDVPVDEDGLDVPALARFRDRVAAVYTTPAHQHPLGVTMPAARRLALLAEAERRDAVVLEDDYDSEFRYDVAPLPALAALDRRRVIYLGTASKALLPGLRMGWLVAERQLVERIVLAREARHDHPPWPSQRALLTLLREGHLDRAVRAARRVYTARGAQVAGRLARYGTLSAPVAGMYLTLLTGARVARAVAEDARGAGVEVQLLADLARSDRRTGLVVGFGGVSDTDLARALDVLERSLRARLRGRGTRA
jgi:GntR family transcriptional regulator/MocR family aminotransferase